MPTFAQVELNLIDPPDLPIRATFDEDKLRELQDSIARNGLLQPIGLKQRDGRYEVEFGHRRFTAVANLGHKTIAALVYAPGELQEDASKLAENIHREKLNTAEEGVWFEQLMERNGWDTDALAARLHQSRQYVEERINLVEGDPEVFRAVAERRITFSVARELRRCPDQTHRRYLLHHASLEQTGARRVAQWVAEFLARNQPAPVEAQPTAAPDAQPMVQAPAICCALCGADRQPYNLVSVMLCRWEWEQIQKVFMQREEQPA